MKIPSSKKLQLKSLLLVLSLIILFCQNALGLTAKLSQISPTYLQLTTDNDMIISSQYQLANIFSITIDSISPSSYTYTFNLKNPTTIEINIVYSQSFIYRYLNLQVTQPKAITDQSGANLDQNSYSTQIQMVIIYSSAEKTIQDIIPYIVWGFFGIFVCITISFLFMKVDTVSIWNILEFFQICGVLNYLNIVKAQQLIIYLSELNKSNFFFIPTWFYQLLQQINKSISTNSSSVFITNNSIDAPSSTSFIRTTGNALFIVFIYTFLTLICSFKPCLVFQKIFNTRSLYRIVDILLIHFVFASVINLRYCSFSSGYNISDFASSIVCLIAFFLYSTIIPCSKVNNIDVIMLDKEVIERNKHFINKARVEYFFSRNFFSFRTIFRSLLVIGLALGTLSKTAAGIITFGSLFYWIIVIILSLRQSLYDDKILNAIQLINTISLTVLLILFIILWSFEQFYALVSRSSSNQIDSSYISINHYLSWSIICLIVIAKISYIVQLVFYLIQTRNIKLQTLLKTQNTEDSQVKEQSQLQEQLVNYNDKSIVQDSQQNNSFVYGKKQMFQTQIEQKNIELSTTQPIQQQNINELNTVQSQLFDSPQKLVNQTALNNTNTSQFYNNGSSLNKSQPNQVQFQAQISFNNQSMQQQPSDFMFSSHKNDNILNNQQEQEHNQNIRFTNKTSTFSAENNERNQL
ncbi:transmembrane protein, putative (macronuclear) [Tetrahymena thermophila SB210]|uniref:Transmembrane protein, putative n=1 Tax=Tetrahymena thermophila (strain SB210) TaxID=312017 RepID=W7XHY2_TETTS|nr:transmembrane protein, putative [Tetrahymena thermophila SB210]EWS72814.1 transmembrane protein, putative [Tetrahymena thermophila SB210]|eukprot:XP_012654640.1 transmembrane protein, putative [Tetrahymena thermophila SB210]